MEKLTDLKFNVLPDKQWVILETFFPENDFICVFIIFVFHILEPASLVITWLDTQNQ